VRSRYYRGLCQPPEIMDATIAHMLSKKQEIIDLFRTQPELSRLSRSRNINYIRKFFAILEDEQLLQEKVLDRCRGRDRLESMTTPE
jgi:hypothetical protein